MASKSAPRHAEEETGRELRLKLWLLAAALVLVAGYAGFMTGIVGTVRREFAAISMPEVAKVAVALAAAITLMAGAALLCLRRRGHARSNRKSRKPMPSALDQLGGRNELLGNLAEHIDIHNKSGRQFALHVVDLDRFRLVNEMLGEANGDQLLSRTAERLLVLVGQPDRVARLGDDEFAVIQPEAGGARHAELFAGRIQDVLKDIFAGLPRRARPAASIGIVISPDHGADPTRLLHNASLALHRAKASGGNGCRVYARDIEMALKADLELEKAIGEGLRQGWFELHFQPRYDLGTRRLLGFEALLHLNHPQRGRLLPASFLATAEASGLIQPLGEWVLHEALAAAAKWPPHLSLSINVAPSQFRGGDFAAAVANALASADFPGERLCLEISEATMLSPSEATGNQLRELKQRGVAIVIDDFGLGDLRLDALARGHCDAVKLDRSLTKSLGHDRKTEEFARSLIGTARAFSLDIMAEGIEGAEQVRFPMASGCEKVQGPLFGRPVPARDLAAIISRDMRKSVEGAPATGTVAAA
jgi:diguanylate cyclase (GGDEF)-like protein